MPVYDGRNGFEVNQYRNLSAYPGEILSDSAVVVFFTVKKYEMKTQAREKYDVPERYQCCLSFNIQEVIVLSDPDPNATPTTDFDLKEHAKGVEFSADEED